MTTQHTLETPFDSRRSVLPLKIWMHNAWSMELAWPQFSHAWITLSPSILLLSLAASKLICMLNAQRKNTTQLTLVAAKRNIRRRLTLHTIPTLWAKTIQVSPSLTIYKQILNGSGRVVALPSSSNQVVPRTFHRYWPCMSTPTEHLRGKWFIEGC